MQLYVRTEGFYSARVNVCLCSVNYGPSVERANSFCFTIYSLLLEFDFCRIAALAE